MTTAARHDSVTGRWPWGAGPAPALRCDECGKRIGRRRLHALIETDRMHLLCGRCLDRQDLHANYYPDCPEIWHDMFDHHISYTSRAAAWFVLTDPERRTA
jgi:hypothetical protein